MCGGNCLIACSDEIDRDRPAVLGEDRQSPVIAAKTRTHREFNAHVFHRPAKENPYLTELERSGQGKLTEMVRGVVPAILPNGRHKRGELEAGPIVTDWRGRFGAGQGLSGGSSQGLLLAEPRSRHVRCSRSQG